MLDLFITAYFLCCKGLPCHANHVHRHFLVFLISVMETLLATVGGGADGAEQNTIWALVWTHAEAAGHAPTFASTWQGVSGQEN